MAKIIAIILFTIWLLNPGNTFSQKDTSGIFIISADYHYGFIIRHRSSLDYIVKDFVQSAEICLSKKTTGQEEWQQLYRRPEFGLGLHYADLGDKIRLGQAYSAFGFITIPCSNADKFVLNYRIGFGFAWLTKHFDAETNYYNIAIGSSGNVFIDLSMNASYRVSPLLKCYGGVGLNHYSNGSWAKPNLGFNVANAFLGLAYYIGSESKTYLPAEPTAFTRTSEFTINMGSGFRENDPPDGPRFFASSVWFEYALNVSRKRSLGGGLDLFYDSSLKPRIIGDSISFKNIYLFKTGLHLSHNLIIGKMAIIMQTGYYLYTKLNDSGNIYSRFGVSYRTNRHFMLNLTLKTHFFKADYIEFGLGYRFDK